MRSFNCKSQRVWFVVRIVEQRVEWFLFFLLRRSFFIDKISLTFEKTSKKNPLLSPLGWSRRKWKGFARRIMKCQNLIDQRRTCMEARLSQWTTFCHENLYHWTRLGSVRRTHAIITVINWVIEMKYLLKGSNFQK